MSCYTLTTGDPSFDSLFGHQGKGIQFSRRSDPPGGTSVLIEGFTGTGKTMLASQLATRSLDKNWPDSGCAVIYTLDQSPHEIVEMIDAFKWMDPGSIEEVDYPESVTDALAGNGRWRLLIKKVTPGVAVGDLWRQVERDTRSPHVRIIVIDAINTLVRVRSEHYDREFRRLVEYTQERNFVEILTLEKIPGTPELEEYVPNCVIELEAVPGPLPRRLMYIKKARNQRHFLGPHDFTIEDGYGICVYPALPARSASFQRTRFAGGSKRKPILFGDDRIDKNIPPSSLLGGSTTLLWGLPGTHKTDLCARFLAEGLRDDPKSSALFVTLKIEPEAFRIFLKSEGRDAAEQQRFIDRTHIITAKDPFEFPSSVFTNIKRKVDEQFEKDTPITRAGVFGLRRIFQMPAYRGSELAFLEVLVRFLDSHDISTLLIDWPDPGRTDVVPTAIDVCSNEIQMVDFQGNGLTINIKRLDYQLADVQVAYGTGKVLEKRKAPALSGELTGPEAAVKILQPLLAGFEALRDELRGTATKDAGHRGVARSPRDATG